jgi:hypothetical protein
MVRSADNTAGPLYFIIDTLPTTVDTLSTLYHPVNKINLHNGALS